ncbi:MAG: RNA-binding cell elongation regulator Jag/EloR, partial [candidate division NC10 bacterium]|nr:RNA-binding cell elongation regulator Jag/EloR [candidate division NC10 bacterium]
MRSLEKEGKTAEEAIQSALEELGVERDRVHIEVLSESNRKVLGLLTVRNVRIRATLLEEEPPLEEAKGLLRRILEAMGIQAQVVGEQKEDCILLELRSQAPGLLIGRKGKTLDALQYLLNRILKRDGIKKSRVLLDAEGYRSRRREEIVSFALRSAEKAKATGKEVVLLPLGPYERRIIHLSLKEDGEVETFSEGDGYLRKVHVVPVRASRVELGGQAT